MQPHRVRNTTSLLQTRFICVGVPSVVAWFRSALAFYEIQLAYETVYQPAQAIQHAFVFFTRSSEYILLFTPAIDSIKRVRYLFHHHAKLGERQVDIVKEAVEELVRDSRYADESEQQEYVTRAHTHVG